MWKLIFIAIFCVYVNARTDEEVKADFIKILLQCNEKNPVEMSELMELQKYKVPTKMETKCLLACAYKKEGALNSKGMYDLQHAYEYAEKEKNGDEKRHENGRKLADICKKVNDVKVSDGDKGCDRAAHLFKCMIDNAPKLGFKI